MTVLRSFEEYKSWATSEFACDILSPEEMTKIINDGKPNEYPCIIHVLPKKDVSEQNVMMFISLNEIEKWCHMLRVPQAGSIRDDN